MKRAIDLSSKHAEIPAHQQESAWKDYKFVQEVFSQTQKESDESIHLNDQWWYVKSLSVLALNAC